MKRKSKKISKGGNILERKFLDLFANKKPILAMLHLKGENDEDVMNRLKREIEIYVQGGVDAIIVENYFGKYDQLEKALAYVKSLQLSIPYGVNCLNVDTMGFELAIQYQASFVQLDSVVGHVRPRDEQTLKAFFQMYRKRYDGCILGGVRFKYQPVLSENSVEEDLKIAETRCDAICVTQDATGQETSLEKIKQFKDALCDFPLIVGAGITPENIEEQFKIADGAIVGSYFKDSYKDDGEVSKEHVDNIINAVRRIRGEAK